MSTQWRQQSERATRGGYRLALWAAKNLGRLWVKVTSIPFCLYFVIFSVKARRASRDYLSRVGIKKVRWWHILRHYHTYGVNILDRIYFLMGKFSKLDIKIHGAEILKEYYHQKTGCILLGSHLGSFEALRALAIHEAKVEIPFKYLMHTDNAQMTNTIAEEINPKVCESIIEIGTLGSLIKVNDFLNQGYFIGVLGDRIFASERSKTCRFLGEDAIFPLNPLLLAYITQAPVVFSVALYRGRNRYDIYFERLADDIANTTMSRQQWLEHYLEAYVARLEYYAKQAPYNWFNFYDFWDTLEQDKRPSRMQ